MRISVASDSFKNGQDQLRVLAVGNTIAITGNKIFSNAEQGTPVYFTKDISLEGLRKVYGRPRSGLFGSVYTADKDKNGSLHMRIEEKHGTHSLDHAEDLGDRTPAIHADLH